MSRRRRDDRGAVSMEMVVLLPTVFVLILGFTTYVGRRSEGQAVTDAAARWAARTISIARDPAAAAGGAEADALDTVRAGRASCGEMSFSWSATDEDVTVTLSCTVDASELLLLPVPGTTTITSTATEPRDQYRESVDVGGG